MILDDFYYLSLGHNQGNIWKYNVISKVDFRNDSLIWQYAISDIGPYLDDTDLMEPPKLSERKIYNLYFENGYIFATISKGIIALSLETGELLWHTDLSFNPLYLSFNQGEIYCRDWERFVALDLTTGKIIHQKKYIGFTINGKVVRNGMNDGLKIKDGKGYFVLDLDAELYLISIDLETAEVNVETELPDVKDQVHTDDIYFEGNRMYIRDCASFLYVYEIE